VSTVAWLTFLARQKRASVAHLRSGEPELTASTALAEVLTTILMATHNTRTMNS
jgi:hypothetical protein